MSLLSPPPITICGLWSMRCCCSGIAVIDFCALQTASKDRLHKVPLQLVCWIFLLHRKQLPLHPMVIASSVTFAMSGTARTQMATPSSFTLFDKELVTQPGHCVMCRTFVALLKLGVTLPQSWSRRQSSSSMAYAILSFGDYLIGIQCA
jgi:hypothetical protein